MTVRDYGMSKQRSRSVVEIINRYRTCYFKVHFATLPFRKEIGAQFNYH